MAFDGYKFKFKFNASHYIDYMHPETIHAHTFHVIFYLENNNNKFITYYEIEKNINEYIKEYMGKCLNFISPFDKITPTLENICMELYKKVENYCNSINIILDRLEISDNSVSWYSLGNTIMINSLNETISQEKLLEHINKIQKENNDESNNDIEEKKYIEEFINEYVPLETNSINSNSMQQSSEIIETNIDIETMLNKYLTKEDENFFKVNSQNNDKPISLLSNDVKQ